MRRRDFIAGLGGAAALPLVARAQERALPVVGFVSPGSPDAFPRQTAAFREGLRETGYVEGENVTIEYHWLGDRFDGVSAIMADIVSRRAAVIVAGGSTALAAKAATATIPIVFNVGEDPVRLGLVASLARPGGNATGTNNFAREVVSRRLGLLHELAPKAVRVAVIVNPSQASSTEATLREVHQAASNAGLQIQVVSATTANEINAAFATFTRERAEALLVAPDGFFVSRRVQFATLAMRDRIPACYSIRDYVEVGGLMSYSADFNAANRQVGVYTGNILKGTKPADLPVVQSTKFELALNLQTAIALGIDVPPTLLAIADEVIE